MNKHTETALPHTHTPSTPLVLVRSKESYKVWHDCLLKINRVDRYTIGVEIDEYFRSLLETIFRATFAHDKFEKLSLVAQAIGKADLLKFFLQIDWEHKVLDHKIYGQLILLLDEVGRMLGGWKKNLQEKTPANK